MHVLLILVIAAFGIFRIYWQYRERDEKTLGWYLSWLLPVAALIAVALELGLIRSYLELEKVIAACCEPEGVIWLATLSVAVALLIRRQRISGCCVAVLWLLITCNGNAWIASWLMHRLERSVSPPDVTGMSFDAVEVLGGGTDISPQGKAELGEAGDRIYTALQLYHDGKAKLLIASGSEPSFMGHARQGLAHQEAEVLWTNLGVAPQDIVEWTEPETTSQEISQLAREAHEHGWKKIAVVTSAWHMPRVLRLCREAKLTVTAIPCDYRGQSMPWSVVFVVPHGKYAFYVQLAFWEYLASLADR
jgi:uncharacterized SAM-binding protein YcdF (DUF218 family)